jgi:hypothetical protein
VLTAYRIHTSRDAATVLKPRHELCGDSPKAPVESQSYKINKKQ